MPVERELTATRQQSRLPERLLMGCGLFFFLWQFVVLLDVPNRAFLEAYFPLVWSALAVALAQRGQTWRRKSFWLLAAGLSMIFLRCLFDGHEKLYYVNRSLTNGIFAFGVCYQLAFGLRKARLLTFLCLLIGAWTLVETAMALLGIWAALYNQTMPNLSGLNCIGINNGRLDLFILCTNTASTLVASILAAAVGLALTRNRAGRAAYLLAIVVMAFATGLTITRTAYITLGFAAGLIAACRLLPYLRKRGRTSERVNIALCAVVAVAVFLAVYKAMGLCVSALNVGRSMVGVTELLEQRPITLDQRIVSNRQYAWKAGYRLLRARPQYLLYGTSVVQSAALLNEFTGISFWFDHAHCLYLQVLVECGVPGLLLMGFFLWRFARAALMLLLGRDRPLWMRLIPVLPITALAAETVECLTLLCYDYPVLPFMMLFMGLTIRFADDPREMLRR